MSGFFDALITRWRPPCLNREPLLGKCLSRMPDPLRGRRVMMWSFRYLAMPRRRVLGTLIGRIARPFLIGSLGAVFVASRPVTQGRHTRSRSQLKGQFRPRASSSSSGSRREPMHRFRPAHANHPAHRPCALV